MAIFKPDVPRITINAEHQRLMWLNFSPTLIVCLFLLYGFLGLIGINFDSDLEVLPDLLYHLNSVGKAGYFLSIIALVFLLRNSIQADIESQFWDQLRMSSLSAWQMTWTRIFTAPILAWISILISSLILSITNRLLYNTDSIFFSGLSIWLLLMMCALIT